MIRPRMLVMVCLLGCSGSQPTVSDKPQTVGIRDLYHSYVDGAERYTNRPDGKGSWVYPPLRVVLPRKSYTVYDNKILWYRGSTKDSPSVVFSLSTSTPIDDDKSITIVGICLGRRVDGGKRLDGLNWHVAVDHCTVY